MTTVRAGGTSSSGDESTTGETTLAETESPYLDDLSDDLRFDGEEY
ncbi:MAG: hypothetical protein IJ493_01110 [Clostridia bacterium]|nr:hypothetical protein [Clostridia bacterium]